MATSRTGLAKKKTLAGGIPDFLRTGDTGSDPEIFLLSRDRSACRRVWKKLHEELLRDWIEERPGTRPWAWWKFDLSEPRRRRVGGTGDLVPAYNCGANVAFGAFGKNSFVDDALISAWRKIGCLGGKKLIPIDENDLPTYESQATFLRRHNLFVNGEEKRIPAKAWEPEAVR